MQQPTRLQAAAAPVASEPAAAFDELGRRPSVGIGMLIREDWTDGIVVGTQAPKTWAAATQPSWHDVLGRELVPGWLHSLRQTASC